MPKLFLFTVCLFSVTCLQAQFMSDVNGRPVLELKYTNIEGSPYLTDEWSVGFVKAPNGKKYEFTRVRYDAYADELEYDQAGKHFRLGSEITAFSCGDGTFQNGFPAIENQTQRSFYQILFDGKVKFLKRIAVRIYTEKQYGSATELKKFMKEETYFLFKNNTISSFKKDKKTLFAVLGDKETLLDSFIKEQKLKLSKTEDVIKVLEKYE